LATGRGAEATQISRNFAVDAADHTFANERTEWCARKKSVEAEAPSGIIENEKPLHENEENVEPGPLARVPVEP
jgi:hypothetical protein